MAFEWKQNKTENRPGIDKKKKKSEESLESLHYFYHQSNQIQNHPVSAAALRILRWPTFLLGEPSETQLSNGLSDFRNKLQKEDLQLTHEEGEKRPSAVESQPVQDSGGWD